MGLFGGTTITKSTEPSYTPEEIRAARSAVGPNADTSTFGAKLQENRANQSASAKTPATSQTAQSADQASRESAKANIQNKLKTSQGTKKTFYADLLASVEGTAESATSSLDKADRWMVNEVKSLQRTSDYISNGINSAAAGATNAISGATQGVLAFQNEAIHDIQGWSAKLHKTLEPVGIGSAIGDLTEVVKNPLGAPQFLANCLTSTVGKICPGFVAEMDNAFKSTKLDGLAHLPSKMMGSIRCLATAADAILSVPFEIMSDVYNGLMDILNAIADLIDAVVTTVMNLLMAVVKALIDAIIPVDDLLEFFSAVGELASMVGGISQMVGGFSAVTNIAGQVGSFASSANGALSNPLGAIPGASGAVGGALGAVGSVTSALRNPEQFLPASIKDGMQKISSIPGLGFVGNHGYSVGNTLDTLSDGVFKAAIKQYSDKVPMIEKYFNRATTPPAVNNQESYPDAYEAPKVGVHETAQGIPQVKAPQKVLENGQVIAYGMTERPVQPGQPKTVSAYGMTETIDPTTGKSTITGTVQGIDISNPYGVKNSSNPYGLTDVR